MSVSAFEAANIPAGFCSSVKRSDLTGCCGLLGRLARPGLCGCLWPVFVNLIPESFHLQPRITSGNPQRQPKFISL